MMRRLGLALALALLPAAGFAQPSYIVQGGPGPAPYVAPATPITQRAPASTDDSSAGYAVGTFWNYNGIIYQLRNNAVGHAMWFPYVAAQAKPVDAIGGAAPLAAYGTRKLRAAYAGMALNIVRASDSTALDIGFLPDGSLDEPTLWGFLANTTGRIAIWYDQSGSSNNALQTIAISRPSVIPPLRMGNSLSIAFDSLQAGATPNVYFTVPATVTTSSQSVSQISLAGFSDYSQSSYVSSLLGTNTQYIGFSNSLGLYLLGWVSVWTMPNRPTVTPAVAGYVSGNTSMRLWMDDATGNWGSVGAQTLTGGFLGGSNATSTGFMEIAAVIFYGRVLSVTEQAVGTAALHREFNTTPQARNMLLFDGDSITEGYGSTNLYNYPRQVMAQLNQPVRVYNTGAFGQTAVQRNAAFPAIVAPAYNASAASNIFSLAAGTNDISADYSVATVQAAITAWVAQVHALGPNTKAIVATILPRTLFTTTGTPPGQRETNRLAINAWIMSGGAGSDAVADFASDSVMGLNATVSNTTYFIDGIHPTQLGYGYLAPIMAAAVRSLMH